MENQELLKSIVAKAEKWLGDAYDEETRKEVRRTPTLMIRPNLSMPSIATSNSVQAAFAV